MGTIDYSNHGLIVPQSRFGQVDYHRRAAEDEAALRSLPTYQILLDMYGDQPAFSVSRIGGSYNCGVPDFSHFYFSFQMSEIWIRIELRVAEEMDCYRYPEISVFVNKCGLVKIEHQLSLSLSEFDDVANDVQKMVGHCVAYYKSIV